MASVPPSQTASVSARRALVVAPHYDDEVLGCGGLVNQLAAAGARVLGIAERVHVGLPDSALALPAHVAAASRAIAARIRESSPDLILAPSTSEISADHRAACAALHEAIQALRSSHEDLVRGLDVLLYEVNHASHPDLLVDVSAQVPVLTAAMSATPASRRGTTTWPRRSASAACAR